MRPPPPPSVPVLRHLRHLLSSPLHPPFKPHPLRQLRQLRQLRFSSTTTTTTTAAQTPAPTPRPKLHPSRQYFFKIGILLAWIPPVLWVQDNIVQIMTVQGASMYPFFNTDYTEGKGPSRDRVLVDMRIPWVGLERGMVVAFWAPHRPEALVVKRIIALEGDEVQTKPPFPFPREIVPKGHVWVEGDHPEDRMTMDSNTYGPVSISLIVGRVKGVVWPWSKAGWIRWQDYRGNARVREGVVDFSHIEIPS